MLSLFLATVLTCSLDHVIGITVVATPLCNIAVASHGGTSATVATLSYAAVPIITGLAIIGSTNGGALIKTYCPIGGTLTITGTDIFGTVIAAAKVTLTQLSGTASCGSCSVSAITSSTNTGTSGQVSCSLTSIGGGAVCDVTIKSYGEVVQQLVV